jgi:hypothetical protein
MRPKVKVTTSISKIPIETVIQTVLAERFRAKVVFLLACGHTPGTFIWNEVGNTMVAYLETNRVARNILAYTAVCDASNNPPWVVNSGQVVGEAWIQFTQTQHVVYVPLTYP